MLMFYDVICFLCVADLAALNGVKVDLVVKKALKPATGSAFLRQQIRHPREVLNAQGLSTANRVDLCLDQQFFAVRDERLQ